MINKLKTLVEIHQKISTDPDEKEIKISINEANELFRKLEKYQAIEDSFFISGTSMDTLKNIHMYEDYGSFAHIFSKQNKHKMTEMLKYFGFIPDPSYVPDQYTEHVVVEMDESLVQNCVVCGETICDYRGAMTEDGRKISGFSAGSVFVSKKENPKIFLTEAPGQYCHHEKCKP